MSITLDHIVDEEEEIDYWLLKIGNVKINMYEFDLLKSGNGGLYYGGNEQINYDKNTISVGACYFATYIEVGESAINDLEDIIKVLKGM